MKYRKQLLACSLLSVLLFASAHAEELTVSTTDSTVSPGQTGVSVDILINEGGNTAGASFTVNYDANKLEYDSVDSSFFGTFQAQGITPDSVEVDSVTYTKGLVGNSATTGKVLLAAAQAENGGSGQGTLFTLTFNVKSDAIAGGTQLSITQTSITNADAGYSTATAIPMLVGIQGNQTDGFTYPTVSVSTTTIDILTIGGLVDTDSDGIDDRWENSSFGNLKSASPRTDSDGDGYSDLAEFNAGTDPNVRNASGGTDYNGYTDTQATLTGDFDGNGSLDIVQRDQVTGEISIWFADQSSTPTPSFTEADMNWVIKATGDYNGDGKSDLLLRNSSNGKVHIYLMDGATQLSGDGSPGGVAPSANYIIAGTGDFDGDGKDDILWRNTVSGTVYIWFIDGSAMASPAAYVTTESNLSWTIVGTDDFNGDSKDDILWYNTSSNKLYIYLMDGATILGDSGSPGAISDSNYAIVSTGDFDGDGNADILWMNKILGQVYIWPMDGAVADPAEYIATVSDPDQLLLTTADPNNNSKSDIFWIDDNQDTVYYWLMDGNTILSTVTLPDTGGAVKNDFDGDGNSDLLWRNSSSGSVYMWFLDGSTLKTNPAYVFNISETSWIIKDTGDFNGDKKADLLYYNTGTGRTHIYLMDGVTQLSGDGSPGTQNPSSNYTIQATGDFDGDGNDDILWRNSVTGAVYIWFLDGSALKSGPAMAFKVPDTTWIIKGTGDFNGDSKADILYYNTVTGRTHIYLMDGTTMLSGDGSPGAVSPSTNYEIVATGDFDGDGKDDLLWRNSSSGTLYIWFLDGSSQASPPAYVLTEPNTTWVVNDAADCNGDGKADIIYYNTSTGRTWVYLMDGATKLSGAGSPGTVNPSTNYELQ